MTGHDSARAQRHHRLSLRLAIGIASLFVLVAVPFLIVSESWGMVWYYIAAPFSGATKPLWELGVAVYVLVTTILAALSWATIAYVCARTILRFTNVA